MKPVSLPLGQTAPGRGGWGSGEEAFLFNEISVRKTPAAPAVGQRRPVPLAFVHVGTASGKALLPRHSSQVV